MIVPYSHLTSFLISGYKPLYTHYFNQDITITFKNYVYSQIHLLVLPDLFNRDAYLYFKAMKFLGGNLAYEKECGQVLKYFYNDVSSMICNVLKNKPDLDSKIEILVDINQPTSFPVVEVNLLEKVKELQEAFSGEDIKTSIFGTGIFMKFSYQELGKLNPNELLALASVLSYYSYEELEPTILEVLV